MKRLLGKVAVVTGASRGAGRGIAQVLGEAGATVYVSGRSTRAQLVDPRWPETIEETAEQVSARGGVGIPVRCDHTQDEEVQALFARVKAEQGRLDILVNNAWGGYQGDMASFSRPFWEQPDRWAQMFTAGVRAHLSASKFAAPIMLAQRDGLIVNTTVYDRGKYIMNLYYDVAKNAVNRMAYGMALELKPYGITAVAVAPGWMRTERVMDTNPSAEELVHTESPQYIGRAILALALDPERLARTGQTLNVGDLAEQYGFTDIDGRRVPTFRMPAEYLRD
jgi:NAD(P)-dependent dehydrogenase (short-subunit alcohol dehydrogenase family)